MPKDLSLEDELLVEVVVVMGKLSSQISYRLTHLKYVSSPEIYLHGDEALRSIVKKLGKQCSRVFYSHPQSQNIIFYWWLLVNHSVLNLQSIESIVPHKVSLLRPGVAYDSLWV